MATLKSIRKRIVSTKSTMKLTRAMKMIASAKLRRAQTRAQESKIYRIETERILRELIATGKQFSSKLLAPQPDAKRTIDLIVVSSDRGMCGAFNEILLNETAQYIRAKKQDGFSVNAIVFGKKGRDYFNRNGIEFSESIINLGEDKLASTVDEKIAFLKERFISGESCETVISFNAFLSLSSTKPGMRNLFPVSSPDASGGYRIEYICEPSSQAVFEHLIEELTRSSFYQAFVESIAGEIAARMMSMDKATKNANDLILALSSKYNRARQGAITTELIDIVSGADAIQ